MKKIDKMMSSAEVNVNIAFTANVKMDNVKIGRGGGVRLSG
jgi:hypothetical protein